MKLYKKLTLSILSFVAILLGALFFNSPKVSAFSLSFSPIKQEKILVPGTTDYITLTLSSAADSDGIANYELEVRPFSVDDENNTRYEAKENYSQIVDWITIPEDDKTGSLGPNEKKIINLTVTVPKNAPAGGQYCAVIIKTQNDQESDIKQVYNLSHRIFAEVAGETNHQGEVLSTSLPGFLFSGNLTAGATIKNQGNVHASARHTLKVFPLIGNEELFTNEEEPKDGSNIIMPGATRYTSIAWDQTPAVGIFRVEYTVEFEGVKNEISKIVIVCPIWLLAIIAAFLAVLIYSIVTRKKGKKSNPDRIVE